MIVNDDDRVIGVAPMFQRRTGPGCGWRQLGTGHRVEPLAEPGREREVASAAVDALRGLPDPPAPSSSTAGTPARRGRLCSPAPGRGPPPPSGASSSGRPRCGWRAGGTTTGSRSGAATSAASTAAAAASSPSAGRSSAWWARATTSRRRSRPSSRSPSIAGCSTWAPAGAPRASGRCCSRRPPTWCRGGACASGPSRPRAARSAPRCSWPPPGRWPTGTAATTSDGRSCARASRRSSAPSSTRSRGGTGGSTWAAVPRATSGA